MKKFTISIIKLSTILFLWSCNHDINILRHTIIPRQDTSKKLLFDGVYHYLNPIDFHKMKYIAGKAAYIVDTPYLGRPLYFFKNGNILFEENLVFEKSDVFGDYLKHDTLINEFYKRHGWGSYTIKQDTIKAIIFLDFLPKNMIAKRVRCFFQGIVTENYTIKDWKIVKPYPNVPYSNKYNNSYYNNFERLNILRQSRNLVFKKINEIKFIDPSRVWIDKAQK